VCAGGLFTEPEDAAEVSAGGCAYNPVQSCSFVSLLVEMMVGLWREVIFVIVFVVYIEENCSNTLERYRKVDCDSWDFIRGGVSVSLQSWSKQTEVPV